MKTKAAAKRFDPSRLARVANEPNLTSLGWTRWPIGSAAPAGPGWLAVVRASLARARHG